MYRDVSFFFFKVLSTRECQLAKDEENFLLRSFLYITQADNRKLAHAYAELKFGEIKPLRSRF